MQSAAAEAMADDEGERFFFVNKLRNPGFAGIFCLITTTMSLL
jgi:hypothetical protein